MGKKTKIIVCLFIALIISSFIWFDFFFLNNNAELFKQELVEAGDISDVVIVFNPGGWGVVTLDKALDFNQIIGNIKTLVEEKGYSVSVVPYYRTRDDIWGKLGSLKEAMLNFPSSSTVFSRKIEVFLKENPNDKIIMAGLSNGAVFVDSTMAKIKENKDRVIAIELGEPFWGSNTIGENILSLKKEKDVLSNGDTLSLLENLFKTPINWAYSNITGNHITLSQAMHISGHDYLWIEIGPSISNFISQRL
jgi:hypothetical protein